MEGLEVLGAHEVQAALAAAARDRVPAGIPEEGVVGRESSAGSATVAVRGDAGTAAARWS